MNNHTSSDRFFLACPFADKDKCKALGGRWDVDARRWYVPNDVDRNLFKKWWTSKSNSSAEA